jgi:hypothetical protein
MLQNAPVVARRSALGCRIRVLVKEYATAIGEGANNPMMASAIRRAAELQALAEEARAFAVRNVPLIL